MKSPKSVPKKDKVEEKIPTQEEMRMRLKELEAKLKKDFPGMIGEVSYEIRREKHERIPGAFRVVGIRYDDSGGIRWYTASVTRDDPNIVHESRGIDKMWCLILLDTANHVHKIVGPVKTRFAYMKQAATSLEEAHRLVSVPATEVKEKEPPAVAPNLTCTVQTRNEAGCVSVTAQVTLELKI